MKVVVSGGFYERRALSAHFPDLLEDALFDLADPHSGQSIDLSNFLQRMMSLLSSEDDTVVAL